MVTSQSGPRTLAALLTSALLAFAVTACGDDSDTTTDTGGAAAPKSETSGDGGGTAPGLAAAQAEVEKLRGTNAEFTPPGPEIDASSLKGKSIWYITLSASIPALNGNAIGVEEAAKALGLQFKSCDGKFQPASQSACIKQAVNAKPAGIVTNGVDPATVVPAMRAAAQAKIPIMALSTSGDESDVLRFIGNGDVESQAAAANWIIADSEGKADVLAVTLDDSVQVKAGAASSAKALKENCPDCKYDAVKLTGGQLGTVASATSSALLKNPNADYGFPQFDFLAPDFARGARQAGRTDKMKMVGTNATPAQVKDVAAGGFQVADAGVNSNFMGWETMDGLLRLILGEPGATDVTAPIRIFDETNVESIDITDAAQESGSWWGEATYKEEFPKLWGAGGA